MPATFEIKVTAIRTATVDGLENVIRKAEWVMKGTEEGQTFELPQTTDMGPADAQNFTPLAEVTEAAVIAWIEAADERIPAIKAHIQYVLDKEVAKAALTNSPMPWAPAPEPAPAA